MRLGAILTLWRATGVFGASAAEGFGSQENRTCGEETYVRQEDIEVSLIFPLERLPGVAEHLEAYVRRVCRPWGFLESQRASH